MKKLIAIIFALTVAFAIGITAFAAEEPNRGFIHSPIEGENPKEICSYALEKGFNYIVLDFSGSEKHKENAEYYKKLANESPIIAVLVMGNAEFLLDYLPNDASVIVKSNISEEDMKSVRGKFWPNVGFFLPFEDEAALQKAKAFSENFNYLLAENLYSVYSEYGYEEYLLDIAEQFPDKRINTYNDLKRVQCPVIRGDYFGDPFELNIQYLINKLNGFDFCVRDYRSLLADKEASATFLTEYFGSTVLDEHADFSVSQKFEITRPTGSTVTIDAKNYTIFGTSNPNLPLYLDGVEIERISKSGIFTVRVAVPKNGASYTFSQGGKSVTIKVKRSGSGGTATTKNLTSCKPNAAEILQSGETEVTLSCVGPSGGSVTAKIAGKTVTLKQVAYANPGIPAKFTAKVNLKGNYPENETTFIGKVTYVLKYNGTTKTKESAEGFYYLGSDARLAIKAAVDMAGVEQEDFDQGLYLTTLRTGCGDYVEEISENGWYKLSMGGFIKPDHANIVTGVTDIVTVIDSIERDIGSDYEKFTLNCANFPAFKGEIYEKALSLTLFNTEYKNLSGINKNSNLMRNIVAVDNGDGSVTLNFYAVEKIWGWDIFTDPEKGTFTIAVQSAPKLSDNPAKPLEGVTVTVCAGHGSGDPGALGPVGEKGVNEADINFANVYAMEEAFKNLGANVICITTLGEVRSVYGRTNDARYNLSDIYICSHSNAVGESSDANLWCGTYVYYHFDHSAEFAKILCDYISGATNRDNEGAEQGYYSVTRLTVCPAVMLEVGFISNPKEFESLIDKRDIQKTANSVARAVIDFIDEYGN